MTGTASIVFAVAPTPAARRLLPVMQRTGEVVELTGTAEADAHALAAHGPNGIVTFSESMLPSTGTLAALLGLPYHDAETLTRLTDKAAQRRALRRAGVDATTQWPLRDVQDWERAVASVGLPAVLKPIWGGGSRDTHRVDDPDAGRAVLDALLRRDPSSGYVLESLLRGAGEAPFGDYEPFPSSL
ncbi:hypothetical protein ABWI13_32600 [Streptomyces koyangensis]